jgi:hypothetical protein
MGLFHFAPRRQPHSPEDEPPMPLLCGSEAAIPPKILVML